MLGIGRSVLTQIFCYDYKIDAIPHLLGDRIAEQLYAGSRTLFYLGAREIDALDNKVLHLCTPVSAYLKTATNESKINKSLSFPDFFNLLLQLADTIHYLYQNRVIHKDIKRALINPDTNQVKLGFL